MVRQAHRAPDLLKRETFACCEKLPSRELRNAVYIPSLGNCHFTRSSNLNRRIEKSEELRCHIARDLIVQTLRSLRREDQS